MEDEDPASSVPAVVPRAGFEDLEVLTLAVQRL